MMFQITNTHYGYIVEAYIIDNPYSTRGYWHPLRNFGDHQGDAIEFRDYDCPRLPLEHIRQLIKQYNPAVKYSRISGTRFTKQSL